MSYPPHHLSTWGSSLRIGSVCHITPQYNRTKPPHAYRKQVIKHLETKTQKTDPQKVELQEQRNVLARRIKLWKTVQAVYMPQVSGYLLDTQDLLASEDPYEFDESKPEQWPLFLPSKLSQDDQSLCHKGVVETEQTLRLAQVQDNLIDLRRLRWTLQSLRTYFKSNVIREGLKTQTKSQTIESGVTLRINRTVHHYCCPDTVFCGLRFSIFILFCPPKAPSCFPLVSCHQESSAALIHPFPLP